MKDRVKDAIILLSAAGAGIGIGLLTAIIGLSPDAQLFAALAVFLFAGWKVKNELDTALDLKCPKCRYQNGNEANFCRNCGATLRNQTIPVSTEIKN